MSISAVIFDMDGLLLDTETIAYNIFVQACNHFKIECKTDIYHKCIGVNSVKMKEIFLEGYGSGFPYDEVVGYVSERYNEATTGKAIPLKPGVIEILETLKKNRTPVAIATSTAHKKAKQKLKDSKILKYFEIIIGGDQVSKSKPDPEIYLKAAKELQVNPSECLALEDSNNGVIAAVKAGMQVVQIPDLVLPDDKIKNLGHKIASSLLDVLPLLEK